jgi:NADH dehydrogenase
MSFPEDLAEKAKRSLVKLSVAVKCGAMVKNITKEGLTITSEGNLGCVEAKTVIWAGGITASSFGQTLALRTNAVTDKGGRVKVNPDLTIPHYPDIYVIGDLASTVDAEGKPLPGLAQVAMQGGQYAAKTILRKVKGQQELPRFEYLDKGSLAVIGRWAAVANAFGVHLSGLAAWVVWAYVHLMYIVTFQNRLLVFLQWAIQDFTFSRGARLITGSAPTDFNVNEEVAAQQQVSAVGTGHRRSGLLMARQSQAEV